MVTMTCICGSSTVKFKHLSRSDFPAEGLKQPCCDAKAEPAPIPEPPKEEVTSDLEETPRVSSRRRNKAKSRNI